MSVKQVGIINQRVIDLPELNIASDTPILMGESNVAHMSQSHPEEEFRGRNGPPSPPVMG